MKREVAIVQRHLAQYRVALYESMYPKLEAEGIRLRLLHGEPSPLDRSKNNDGEIAWAELLPAHYALDEKLCWMPYGDAVMTSDLVIVTQENKLIYNLLGLTLRRPQRFAFWGHGGNLQATESDRWKERFKRWTTNRVDWWFAYTQMTVERLRSQGYPLGRITNLENAIDTRALAQDCAGITDVDLRELRNRWDLGDNRVALYLGSLYHEKRIEFLLEAAAQLAARHPDFRLVIVGNGPQRELVESALTRCPWLRYVGPQHGRNKAAFLRLAHLALNPGLVGLGILDTFVGGAPILTTDCGIHSPEIAYLETGVNGVMTPNDMADYVRACSAVWDDRALHARLCAGAAAAATRYTIENMSQRFCDGILQALETQR